MHRERQEDIDGSMQRHATSIELGKMQEPEADNYRRRFFGQGLAEAWTHVSRVMCCRTKRKCLMLSRALHAAFVGLS